MPRLPSLLASASLVSVVAGLGLLGLLPSCSLGAVPTVDCATATIPTYSQLSSVMAYCTDCHGAGRAEQRVRYDTYAYAKQAAQSGAETIADGSMPEDSSLPDSAAQQFYIWAQCGTPE